MKIIIIKEYKNLKANQIIVTSDGYAKNFLIKKGYALAYNSANQKLLTNKLMAIKKKQQEEDTEFLKIKENLEKITIKYKLKVSQKNVIGSISTKSVLKKLHELGITLPKHALQHVNIKSLGISYATIKFNKNIQGKLKIEVSGENV